MFRTTLTRKFKFLSYLTDFTEARQHGANPYQRLFMSIASNRLVPVELRKLYYFFKGMTKSSAESSLNKELEDSINGVLRSMGLSESEQKEVAKVIRARINTLDLKVVGKDFKKQLNL
jgi:hypothetical protein